METQEIYKIILEMKGTMGEMHSDIKATLKQAEKTNGRVNALENEVIPEIKEDLQKRKDFENGVKTKVAVISSAFGVVGFAVSQWDSIIKIIKKLIV